MKTLQPATVILCVLCLASRAPAQEPVIQIQADQVLQFE